MSKKERIAQCVECLENELVSGVTASSRQLYGSPPLQG
jgi:hypothetical protein